MLDGLERVDWSRYHHAYGPATDVPALLRALADERTATDGLRAAAKRAGKSVFGYVEWTLWGNVFHQGTRWGVTAHVVPFLVELFEAGLPVEKRRFLVVYLHHLARGYPQDVFPGRWDHAALDEAAAQCAGLPQGVLDGDAFGEEAEGHDTELVEAVWMRDCDRAVAAAVPRLAAGLRDPDEEVALATIALFADLPEAAGVPLPSGSPRLAAASCLARAVSGGGASDAATWLAHEDPAVRTWAAAAVAFGGPWPDGPVGDAAAAVLLAPSPEGDCPFTGALGNLANRATVQLPERYGRAIVDRLGGELRSQRGFGKLDATASLLGWVGHPPTTETARAALRWIVDHGDWGDSINVNQAELLRGAGLPTDRAKLRELLG